MLLPQITYVFNTDKINMCISRVKLVLQDFKEIAVIKAQW
jgi:hypothetical protein